MLAPNPANIPATIKAVDHWALFRLQYDQNGRLTKVPYQTNGRNASHSNPATWCGFDQALATYGRGGYDGLLFAASDDDPFVVGDLDDCIDDAGAIGAEARAILDGANTYTEITPSGRGLRFIGIGYLPATGRRKDDIGFEFYRSLRFVSFTGHRLEEYPAEPQLRIVEFGKIYDRIFGKKEPQAPPQPRPPAPLDDRADADLIELARKSNPGFDALWRGDAGAYRKKDGCPDYSRADSAFAFHAAYWTDRDEARMDRWYRASGLFRDKWDEVHYATGETYGQHTLREAIALANGRSDCAPAPTAAGPAPSHQLGDSADPATSVPPAGQPDCGRQLAAALKIIRVQQNIIQELRRENDELRAVQRAENELFASPNLTPTEKVFARALATEVVAVQNSKPLPLPPDANGFYRTFAARFQETTGFSENTVGRTMKGLEERGLIQTLLLKHYDPDTDQIRSEKYIKPTAEERTIPAVLTYFAAAPAETRPDWGGQRVKANPNACPDCGDAGTVVRMTVTCINCGQVIREREIEHGPCLPAEVETPSHQLGDSETLPPSVEEVPNVTKLVTQEAPAPVAATSEADEHAGAPVYAGIPARDWQELPPGMPLATPGFEMHGYFGGKQYVRWPDAPPLHSPLPDEIAFHRALHGGWTLADLPRSGP